MLSFRRDLDVAWSPGSAGRGNAIHVAAISVEGACAKWSAGLVRYATALVGVDDDGDLVADAFAEVLQREDFRRTVREPERCLIGVTTNLAKMRHQSTWCQRNREVRYHLSSPESELLSDLGVVHGLFQLAMRRCSPLDLAYWLDMTRRDIATT